MGAESRRIVVGYDGTPAADLALRWAAEAARRRGYAVDTVVVTNEDAMVEDHRPLAAATVTGLANERLAPLAVAERTLEVRTGAAVPALLDAAQGAAMLVVGTRGRGPLASSLAGSVSQHVARHAPCPVVVVRDVHPRARRVIVGVDGSPESERALRFACEHVRAHPDQNVVAVYGYRAYRPGKGNVDEIYSPDTVRRIDEAERLVNSWVAAVAGDYPDVELSAEAIAEPPDRLLVNCSSVAALLVVGSRGRGAFTGLLLGSVSQHVLYRATSPVAVVR